LTGPASTISNSAASMLVVGGALPAVISAQQMAATPLSRLIVDQLALLAFALPVAVVTLWWMQVAANRLLGWLGSAATTVLLVLAARLAVATMDQAVMVLAVSAAATAAVLLNRADLWWRYLAERAA